MTPKALGEEFGVKLFEFEPGVFIALEKVTRFRDVAPLDISFGGRRTIHAHDRYIEVTFSDGNVVNLSEPDRIDAFLAAIEPFVERGDTARLMSGEDTD